MKRFFKTLCLMLSLAMLFTTVLSLAACEDLKTVEVKVSVYDITNEKMVDKTIKITLYRHLADDTVDAITDYANKGYYNDLILYKNAESNTTQIMIGDVNYINGNVVDYASSVDYVHSVAPEFNAAGVTGSDLKNVEGSVGLWRSWYESGSYTSNVNEAFNSGKSTLYMPTADITSFNGYFTVFGKIDLTDTETSEAISLIKSVLNNSTYYTQYTIYYTGEYGSLAYNCMLSSEFDEQFKDEEFKESVFAAKGDQLVGYNKRKINVPVAELGGVRTVCVKVTSVSVS